LSAIFLAPAHRDAIAIAARKAIHSTTVSAPAIKNQRRFRGGLGVSVSAGGTDARVVAGAVASMPAMRLRERLIHVSPSRRDFILEA
jgi:hypothetical protein